MQERVRIGEVGRGPEFPDSRAADVANFVVAGAEILLGQLGIGGLEPISTSAGRLLFEQGVVGSVDDGIVLFHERITVNKPSLRTTLRKLDRRAGRLPKLKPRSPAQRAVIEAMRAGEVRRTAGKLTGFTPKARRAIAAAKRRRVLATQAARDKRQKTAAAKLQGLSVTPTKKRKR